MDPFPESWSSETVVRAMGVLLVVFMIMTGITIKAIQRAAANAPPLQRISAGKAGDVLKVRPTLPKLKSE